MSRFYIMGRAGVIIRIQWLLLIIEELKTHETFQMKIFDSRVFNYAANASSLSIRLCFTEITYNRQHNIFEK